MTRSMFDPTGPDAGRGRGNRYLGEEGQNFSQMPPAEQEQPAQDKVLAEGQPGEEAANNDEAAERLTEMAKQTPPDPNLKRQLDQEIDRNLRG